MISRVFAVPAFPPAWGVYGGNLEGIAGLEHLRFRALDRKLEAAFQHIGQPTPGMGVPPDRDARVDFCLHQENIVTRRAIRTWR